MPHQPDLLVLLAHLADITCEIQSFCSSRGYCFPSRYQGWTLAGFPNGYVDCGVNPCTTLAVRQWVISHLPPRASDFTV